MQVKYETAATVWEESKWTWALVVGAGILAIVTFRDSLQSMVEDWIRVEEYGYGFAIPMITAFLIWQKKNELQLTPLRASWLGVAVVGLSALVYVAGEISTVFTLQQYGFVMMVFGIAISMVGVQGFKKLIGPLVILFFMIPLPDFIFQNLSGRLQLISSEIGVFFIRLFDIAVNLEGNIIDLGAYKLQVVEACSGLRYLFPLACLSFIAAYVYRGELWKKAVIFLSSIPITVGMNSFRIGAIAVLVEYYGPAHAEGFLHDFEGWVVFMACMTILIVEMWVLGLIGPDPLPLSERFSIDFPDELEGEYQRKLRPISRPLVASVVVMIGAAIGSGFIQDRAEIIPERSQFYSFPMQLNDWKGQPERMESIYQDALMFDDYLYVNYRNDTGGLISFYVAYYASQRKGQSAHSPRSCMPGGGWQIASLADTLIDPGNGRNPFAVNRVVIKRGDEAQLVYYWFQQRGRRITNEYVVKWYLFWDAFTRSRTDGALVRVSTMQAPGESQAEADERLRHLIGLADPILEDYVPD